MDLLSFILLGLVFLGYCCWYIRKDRNNFIQPHAYYTANQAVLLWAFPLIQFYIARVFVPQQNIPLFNMMIAISYISFSFGFFIQKQSAMRFFSRWFNRFNPQGIPKPVLNLHLMLMAFCACLLFWYMTEKSGLGLLSWLREPRTGYQNYRRGLGHVYVISLALFNFMYLYILFFKIKRLKSLILTTLIFIFILFFFGCKGTIVAMAFEGVIFYNFFIKKLNFRSVLTVFFLIAVLFILMFSIYSSKLDTNALSSRLLVYASFYNDGATFFSDFDNHFDFMYGREYLSGLWSYVPRAFYPDKPYSYGVVKYVVEHYYPNAGMTGNTPAFGGPVEAYLNFGIPGIILAGFLHGYIVSLFYTYFIAHKNFLGFVMISDAMGFSIFPVMTWVVYKIAWYVFNYLCLLLHKQLHLAIYTKLNSCENS